MTRLKTVFTGALSAQLFSLVSVLLSLAVTPVVVAYLGAGRYGLWLVLTQVVGYLGLFDVGMRNGLMRFLAQHRTDDEVTSRLVSTGLFGALVVSAAAAGGGWLLAAPLATALPVDELGAPEVARLIGAQALWFACQYPLRVVGGVLFVHQRQLLSHVIDFGVVAATVAASLVFLALGLGLWSLVLANYVALVPHGLALVAALRRHFPHLRISPSRFDLGWLVRTYRFSFFLFLNAFAWLAISSTDRLIIGAFESVAAVAAFSLTVRLQEFAQSLIFKLTDNAFPEMVDLDARGRRGDLARLYHGLTAVTVSLSAAAFWMVVTFGETFLTLWVGPEYFAGDLILVLAGAILLYHCWHHVGAILLQGAGLMKTFSLVSLVEAALNVGLSVVLVRRYGVAGVLAGTLAAGLLTSGWYTPVRAMRHLGLSAAAAFVRPVLVPAAVVGAAGALLWLLEREVAAYLPVTWGVLTLSAAVWSVLMLAAAGLGLRELATHAWKAVRSDPAG